MRNYGKHLSRWWFLGLLLCVPLCVLALPFLTGLSNAVGSTIFGPPAIWDRPTRSVSASDLYGTYEEVKRNIENGQRGSKARLIFAPSGSVEVSGLPYEFYPKTCLVSGVGTWAWSGDGSSIDMKIVSNQSPGACDTTSYGNMLVVAGRSRPYRLYHSVGDPDSGEGVWLARQ